MTDDEAAKHRAHLDAHVEVEVVFLDLGLENFLQVWKMPHADHCDACCTLMDITREQWMSLSQSAKMTYTYIQVIRNGLDELAHAELLDEYTIQRLLGLKATLNRRYMPDISAVRQ